MSYSVIQFEQYVCQDYFWCVGDVTDHGLPYKTVALLSHPLAARSYDPMRDEPTLFKHFAQMETTQGSILAFVRQYGFLGVLTMLENIKAEDEPDLVARIAQDGSALVEPLGTWKSAVDDFRATLGFCEAVRGGETERLGEYVTLDPPESAVRVVCRLSNTSFALDLHRKTYSHLMPAYQARDMVALGEACIMEMVNKRLEGKTKTAVTYNQKSQPELHTVPTCLYGALWLQFAHMFTGCKTYHQCPNCGRDFEVRPDLRKRSARFCSDSCRSAYHYRRKVKGHGSHGTDEPGEDRPGPPVR